mgnify:CR=1 FL=1
MARIREVRAASGRIRIKTYRNGSGVSGIVRTTTNQDRILVGHPVPEGTLVTQVDVAEVTNQMEAHLRMDRVMEAKREVKVENEVAVVRPGGVDEVKTGLQADGAPAEVGTDHRTSDLISL